MNIGALHRYIGIIVILLIISFKSRGSVTLPQLSYSSALLTDTIPGKKQETVVEQRSNQTVQNENQTVQNTNQTVKEITAPIIKEVPKAKKQLKPIAVVPIKTTTQIVKPKIVIQKIGVRIH